MIEKPRYININGELIDVSRPQVMGILNLTPDSFYAASRKQTREAIQARALEIDAQGGTYIDVGAYSSRPNAIHISQEEEMERLRGGLQAIHEVLPNAKISVDTFRADIARMCVEEYGVAIINDISSGDMDAEMFPMMARLNVPYIIMHMQGTPQTMQKEPHYENFLKEVFEYFSRKIGQLQELGVKDVIVDPGFGFGKTISHNYELLAALDEFKIFDLPILVGVSRKSMIYKYLNTSSEEALNGTTVIHTLSLERGANILRVHDVREAMEAIKLVDMMKKSDSIRRY